MSEEKVPAVQASGGPGGGSTTFDAYDLINVTHSTDDPTETTPPVNRRIAGIDLARALALLGMMIVHLVDPTTDQGTMPWVYRVASGNAAALFAVLAGVGIALSTGRSRRPRGRAWIAAAVSLVMRALFIGAVGVALGLVVPTDTANVILPYYAVLFVLAIPLLRLRPAALAILGVLVAVGMPIVSHAVRSGLVIVGDPQNITPADLVSDPAHTLRVLTLTGVYPALCWMAYLCLGMAIGRLRMRRVMALGLLIIGTALALVVSLASWAIMTIGGGREALAAAAQAGGLSLDDFTTLLVWGGGGTTPTNSWWWLTLLAPHTSTPFDLLYTAGIAMAVLGGCLMIAVVVPELLYPFTVMGAMPLSMYALHLLMTASPWGTDSAILEYGGQAVVLLIFAMAWSRFFKRGPLETVLSWLTRGSRALVLGRQR